MSKRTAVEGRKATKNKPASRARKERAATKVNQSSSLTALLEGKLDQPDAALEGADLGGRDLKGANLSGADLRKADLTGADLEGANLARADLEGANLKEANLSGVDFSKARVQSVDLAGAQLEKAELGRAKMQHSNLEGASLRGAKMRGVNLSGANLRGADLSGADLATAYLQQANLEEVNFEGCHFLGAFLQGASLPGAALPGAQLQGVNFLDADLHGANLEGADLKGAYLRGCALGEANLREANLEGVFAEFTHFEKARLCGASMKDAEIQGADFRQADLRDAKDFWLSDNPVSGTVFSASPGDPYNVLRRTYRWSPFFLWALFLALIIGPILVQAVTRTVLVEAQVPLSTSALDPTAGWQKSTFWQVLAGRGWLEQLASLSLLGYTFVRLFFTSRMEKLIGAESRSNVSPFIGEYRGMWNGHRILSILFWVATFGALYRLAGFLLETAYIR
ncbi:MAG: pentapeptide repeat-containing protein [Verrucomicrobiota bacterium]